MLPPLLLQFFSWSKFMWGNAICEWWAITHEQWLKFLRWRYMQTFPIIYGFWQWKDRPCNGYGQCIRLFPSQNKCFFICGKCQGSWHYLCHILCIWRGQQWAWSWLQLFHDYVHIEWKYKILEILAICNTLKCLHQLTTKFTYWCKIASQCSEHVCLLPQGRGSLRNTFTCQPPREESPYTKKTWWHQIWHSLLMCYRSLLMS